MGIHERITTKPIVDFSPHCHRSESLKKYAAAQPRPKPRPPAPLGRSYDTSSGSPRLCPSPSRGRLTHALLRARSCIFDTEAGLSVPSTGALVRGTSDAALSCLAGLSAKKRLETPSNECGPRELPERPDPPDLQQHAAAASGTPSGSCRKSPITDEAVMVLDIPPGVPH